MKIEKIERHDRPFPKYNPGDRYSYAKDRKQYTSKPRVYVSVKGESLLDQLQNRRERPSTLYKKVMYDQALAALGLTRENAQLSWSQKAGCQCGCSPAFILKARKGKYCDMPLADVWVTVVGDDAVVEGRLQSPVAFAAAATAQLILEKQQQAVGVLVPGETIPESQELGLVRRMMLDGALPNVDKFTGGQ